MFRHSIYKNSAVYLSDSRVTLFHKIWTFGSLSIVYANDRSKAAVLVLFILSVWLCGFYYKSCLALSSHVFFSPFSILIALLGVERESWSQCFSCIGLFILQALTFVLLFLLVSGDGWLVTVANPGLFYYSFGNCKLDDLLFSILSFIRL